MHLQAPTRSRRQGLSTKGGRGTASMKKINLPCSEGERANDLEDSYSFSHERMNTLEPMAAHVACLSFSTIVHHVKIMPPSMTIV